MMRLCGMDSTGPGYGSIAGSGVTAYVLIFLAVL
jgi:hypothetical protein